MDSLITTTFVISLIVLMWQEKKAASKVMNTALFGIFSISRNSKQWHCNNCGADF